jgi:hypothetical protein
MSTRVPSERSLREYTLLVRSIYFYNGDDIWHIADIIYGRGGPFGGLRAGPLDKLGAGWGKSDRGS